MKTASAKKAGSRAPKKKARPKTSSPPKEEAVFVFKGDVPSDLDLASYPVLGLRVYEVEALRKDPRNARVHDERNLRVIAASLKEYGQRKNIVVTSDGEVKAGNGTLEAAASLGWKYIVGGPSPVDLVKARRYALADNRSGDLSWFDNAVLGNELGELSALGDVESLGWEPDEALVYLGVSYRVVVEEPEYPAYAKTLGKKRLLVLDRAYQRDYETCDDLGDSKTKGSGPARNFIWDHAAAAGSPYHWIMDDNIYAFYRLNRNLKVPMSDGTNFFVMEEFSLRYENLAMAGPNYFMFASRKAKMAPYTLNTRVYSCNLIRTDVPFRWRARYNEDTDLSLRMLKAGWCTVLFNAFLQEKATTQTLKGGNTDELYREGTLAKSRMIVGLHPDVAKVAFKFGRWHHHVDYSRWRSQRLRRRPGVEVDPGVNDFGMKLRIVGDLGHRGASRKKAG